MIVDPVQGIYHKVKGGPGRGHAILLQAYSKASWVPLTASCSSCSGRVSPVFMRLLPMFVAPTEPSDRPCRLYFVRTFGEPVEQTWVEDRATQTFYGGYEFEQLPPMRRRGKQREQTAKQTVISV